jgi:hypothetical protein
MLTIIVNTEMSGAASGLPQQLWLLYRAQARTLPALQADAPMVQGSLYLLSHTLLQWQCLQTGDPDPRNHCLRVPQRVDHHPAVPTVPQPLTRPVNPKQAVCALPPTV